MSALAAELLEAGREAPQREEELHARIAKLEAELKVRPPHDFQDSILKLAPGTAHVLRQREAARSECAELKAKLAEADTEALEWQE